MTLLRRHWPLPLALLLLWLAIAGAGWRSLQHNDGSFVYALDDAWIHMSIAENVARHGVFGLTPYEFSASSSSLLWTGLLSGVYAAAGVHELTPLVLGVVFASLVLVVVHGILTCGVLRLRPGWVFLCLLFVALATPLPTLVLSGMEHPLHILVALAFVYLAARVLAADRPSGRHRAVLLLLSPFVATARYEGLFLGFVVFVLFLLRRRWVFALVLGGLVMAPVVAFAAYSVQQGGDWLPNSLLLKGNFIRVDSVRGLGLLLGGVAYRRCIRNPHVFYLIVAALLGFIARYDRRRLIWEEGQVAVLLFLGTTFFHLQFAMLGWFYRYESYVIALGLFACALSVVHHLTARTPSGEGEEVAQQEAAHHVDWQRLPRTLAILVLAFFPAMILAKRGAIALIETPQAMHDRYLEHVQIARFVARYYNEGPVVVNDAGAVTFYSDARILDMYGLADTEPIRFRRQGDGYTKEDLAAWTAEEGARIAILQVAWKEVHEKLPESWTEVGRWTLPRNVAFPEDTVTAFYAIEKGEAERLAASLREFGTDLPKAVAQSGPYVEEPPHEQ
jgi:hypothetical protein